MAVDYLSALNKNGSGLNISELVSSLTLEETAPKKDLVQKKVDNTTIAISELATVKSKLQTLDTDLYAPTAGSGVSTYSSDSAVTIAVTDPFQVNAFSSKIVVTSLAAAQVFEFTSFNGVDFTSETDALSSTSDTLTIDFGSWSSGSFIADSDIESETITVAADATLVDLADALNDIDGITAYVIETTSGSFSLVVKTLEGTENSINITSTGGYLDDFNTSDTDGSILSQIVSPTDAVFTVDGISLTRSSNTIDDAFNGITLTLTDITSSANISVTEDSSTALVEMKAFIEIINENRKYFDTITKRGVNGVESGPFAGSVGVNAVKKYLRELTLNPIEGFDEDDIYLADLGVLTETDGTLSLDEDKFLAAFATNPNTYRAVFQSQTWSGSSSFDTTLSTYADLTPGVYDLEYDSSTTTLSIDGVSFSIDETVDGYTTYYDGSGVFTGLKLTAPTTASDVSSYLYVGKSMIATIREYLSEVLSSSGSIKDMETAFAENSSSYADELLDLQTKADALKDRYLIQFGAMEAMVTNFKRTGDQLTNMMDAWSKN